jgi:hypothetical protein
VLLIPYRRLLLKVYPCAHRITLAREKDVFHKIEHPIVGKYEQECVALRERRYLGPKPKVLFHRSRARDLVIVRLVAPDQLLAARGRVNSTLGA